MCIFSFPPHYVHPLTSTERPPFAHTFTRGIYVIHTDCDMTTPAYGCGFNNLTNQILLALPLIVQYNVHANVNEMDLNLCTVHA